ncbi:methylglyoxal synthase [Clostridium felsineum]|uniref:Methylglyoxal synthase n=1 Tax=Clostridium felsineum TaxID=36839 RepID=A0A1S8MCP1_9CLOT|nr:methylglyoxal synthase [Clostridium felsineum]URZ06895.1 Methylglyoxal synthase [Clostridium felsineum]URZ11927.1 Methylglyoxal synthase [Clostridium felsineum]
MALIMKNKKKIALVAHDNRKKALIDWCKTNVAILSKHDLCGTGTTAKLISEETGLQVLPYKSGPMGGDQQIGAAIVNEDIDFMIFFWDPLTAQPHDPDVKALLRISVLYDIVVAMNESTADFLIKSPVMDKEHERHIIDYYQKIRANNF